MKERGRGFKWFIPILVLIVLVVLGTMWVAPKMEKHAPEIVSDLDTVNVGRNHEIEFIFTEQGAGLKHVRVLFEQNGHETILFEQFYPKGSGVMNETVKVMLNPQKFKVEEGPASFRALAWDHSWRSLGDGSRTEVIENVVIDMRPPVISSISSQHNIRQGGSGLVVYSVSKPVAKTGVWAGDQFFPGRSGYLKDDVNVYLAFVALGNDAPQNITLRIEAVDKASYRAEVSVYNYIKTYKFREDKVNISDKFLRQVVPPFYPEVTADTPIGEVLEKYIYINDQLRVANDAKIFEITSTDKSEPLMYWEGAFLRLPGSAERAKYGDKRDYIYNGKVIDKQTHLGYDLASLAHAPIPAANRGKVVFTGDMGIYGLTVILDHGFGLFSLYAHMSSIGVTVGDIVEKADTLGHTGITGLAVGDHLHYSILINGHFVDPLEWWDAKWIKDNITDKLPQ